MRPSESVLQICAELSKLLSQKRASVFQLSEASIAKKEALTKALQEQMGHFASGFTEREQREVGEALVKLRMENALAAKLEKVILELSKISSGKSPSPKTAPSTYSSSGSRQQNQAGLSSLDKVY